MQALKIIGLGNALADILTQIASDEPLRALGFGRGSMNLVGRDTHERIDTLTHGLEHRVVSGGSAANTMRGLARLGVTCSYIGKIGPDTVGDFMKNEMRSLGVRPQLIETPTPTGRCRVLISPDGERTMATFLGAAVELTPEEITPEMFAGYDILHIEGYLVQNHALIRGAVEKAKAAGLRVSLDMASYNVVEENLLFLKELVVESVDLLFANEDEARAFTGKEPHEAVREIGALCEIAVVKIGAAGSLIHANGQVIAVAASPAQVVDTTGAGDLYATGFLYGLSHGLPLSLCGQIGSLVAAKAIETVGPSITEDHMEEIRQWLADLNR
ncbi:MAG: adenosine kinase [Rikenellaceae bacterium]|jgi:sugar/nucleoside kinase (ribokinase family)|nr:adenosine kinase [Rikenellaceae bacterium]